jgi:hypothetical protein
VARKGIGTVIGRKSVSKGREYTRIWIYIPTKVSEDTAFPFKIGDPCLVEIDVKQKTLTIKPIPKNEAAKLGWKKRKRREKHENIHAYP